MLENTSVTLDSVCQIWHSWQWRGVGEGVGGEGVLVAAGECGDDVLVVGPEEGTGDPGGFTDTIVLIFGDSDGAIVAG